MQALRALADDSVVEHDSRRELVRRVAAKSVELQLCDLEGVCKTDAFIQLGPEVRVGTINYQTCRRSHRKPHLCTCDRRAHHPTHLFRTFRASCISLLELHLALCCPAQPLLLLGVFGGFTGGIKSRANRPLLRSISDCASLTRSLDSPLCHPLPIYSEVETNTMQ